MLAGLLEQVRRMTAGSGLRRRLARAGVLTPFTRLYRRSLLRQGTHEATLFGRRVRFVVGSDREITRINSLAVTEKEFVSRILGAVRPGDVFFDVGANIGVHTLIVGDAMRGKGVTVHAFEPEPRNAEHLRKNVELNGLSGVSVHQVALGDRASRMTLYVDGEVGTGTHSLVGAGVGGRGGETRRGVEIEVATGDAVADRVGVAGGPGVIKIDVEGFELHVLEGLRGRLGSGGVHDVLIELHPPQLAADGKSDEDVRRLMESCGFGLAWSSRRGDEFHQHYTRG